MSLLWPKQLCSSRPETSRERRVATQVPFHPSHLSSIISYRSKCYSRHHHKRSIELSTFRVSLLAAPRTQIFGQLLQLQGVALSFGHGTSLLCCSSVIKFFCQNVFSFLQLCFNFALDCNPFLHPYTDIELYAYLHTQNYASFQNCWGCLLFVRSPKIPSLSDPATTN